MCTGEINEEQERVECVCVTNRACCSTNTFIVYNAVNALTRKYISLCVILATVVRTHKLFEMQILEKKERKILVA